MIREKTISGFSKKSKKEKIAWLQQQFLEHSNGLLEELQGFWHTDKDLQQVLDGFSENTLSNFFLPYGIAPNFLINDRVYAIPMVIEESSVVAAASSAAKFWLSRGGFRTEVLSTTKIGQVHFNWTGNFQDLERVFPKLEVRMREEAAPITANMEKRGGGVLEMQLLDMSAFEPDYYQLRVKFETCDSMGANFINSVLESFGRTLTDAVEDRAYFQEGAGELEVIMAILSNYTPECLVRAEVSCPIEALEGACRNTKGPEFARRFYKAVRIAHIDPYRAATHNKGIFNGIDAVVLATGNDFRAIEACGHTHAAADGHYRSLSFCSIDNGQFRFWLDIPLAIGTVGGLTKLHPLARRSLELLGKPNAEELMQVIAATGLAQNFAALRSLVTTGIQQGHMKMHLTNILNHLGAQETEAQQARYYFGDKTVSFTAVRDFLEQLRQAQSNGHSTQAKRS